MFWMELVTADAPRLEFTSDADIAAHRKPGVDPTLESQESKRSTLLYVEDNPANLALVEQLIARRSDIRLLTAINAYLGTEVARPLDPGTVQILVPQAYKDDVVSLLTDIEQLKVDPDDVATVVIDEATGTIVMGENVRISTVAIAQGQLTIRITETPQVSQPSPFSTTGTTTTVQRSDVQVDEGSQNRLAIMDHGVTLQELVNNLNALGIGPRDMIAILHAIKAAGALQAQIRVM